MPLTHPNKRYRTAHQIRVEEFMAKAKQTLPAYPSKPNEEVRRLRARLILEEALETITALGFAVSVDNDPLIVDIADAELRFHDCKPFNMVEAVDGCCDLSVVTTGTLSALGVADEPFLYLVDTNNLGKFGPGSSIREDGKLIKPPGHKPPNILLELVRQGYPDPAGDQS